MFGHTLAAAALVMLLYMLGLYVVALMLRDNGIVDIGWGPGFILMAFVALLGRSMVNVRELVVTTLVAVWGLRLAVHILLRHWGRGEDWRYAASRRRWGPYAFLGAFLEVFMSQGVLALGIALPVLWVNTFAGPAWGWLDWVGLAVWLFGFFWEAVGDLQLNHFLASPTHSRLPAGRQGRIMRSGLWRYSRHPNYFGEAAMWWGLWLIALSVPGGWLTVLGPATITFLLLKVSGVPMLEAKQMRNEEFRNYARHTSAFIPRPPK